MFGRSEPQPDSAATAAPQPVEKPPARDARVFAPSSFASRRAERGARGDAPPSRRLVDMGMQKRWVPRGGSLGNGQGQMVEYRAFMDSRRPRDIFVEWVPGGPIVPMDTRSGGETVVQSMGTMPRKPRDYTPTRGSAPPDTRTLLDD